MTKATLDERLADIQKKVRGAQRRLSRADHQIVDLVGTREADDEDPIEADWSDEDTEVTMPVRRHVRTGQM